MKPEKCVLEIHDEHGRRDYIELQLVDNAYRTKITDIKEEAYKIMLPGDTITVVYKIDGKTVEVDYTYPEHRLHVDGARRETDLFDRIITYKSSDEYSDNILHAVYESCVLHVGDELLSYPLDVECCVEVMFFYSNYLSRLANVGLRNVVRVNRGNPGFVP